MPFRNWTRNNGPSWWTAHNRLKHSEYEHKQQGNLQNATNAIAANEIVLRSSTQGQGTVLFSPWGTNWAPGQLGIKLLFGAEENTGLEKLSLKQGERRLKALGLTTGDESTPWLRELRDAR